MGIIWGGQGTPSDKRKLEKKIGVGVELLVSPP